MGAQSSLPEHPGTTKRSDSPPIGAAQYGAVGAYSRGLNETEPEEGEDYDGLPRAAVDSYETEEEIQLPIFSSTARSDYPVARSLHESTRLDLSVKEERQEKRRARKEERHRDRRKGEAKEEEETGKRGKKKKRRLSKLGESRPALVEPPHPRHTRHEEVNKPNGAGRSETAGPVTPNLSLLHAAPERISSVPLRRPDISSAAASWESRRNAQNLPTPHTNQGSSEQDDRSVREATELVQPSASAMRHGDATPVQVQINGGYSPRGGDETVFRSPEKTSASHGKKRRRHSELEETPTARGVFPTLQNPSKKCRREESEVYSGHSQPSRRSKGHAIMDKSPDRKDDAHYIVLSATQDASENVVYDSQLADSADLRENSPLGGTDVGARHASEPESEDTEDDPELPLFSSIPASNEIEASLATHIAHGADDEETDGRQSVQQASHRVPSTTKSTSSSNARSSQKTGYEPQSIEISGHAMSDDLAEGVTPRRPVRKAPSRMFDEDPVDDVVSSSHDSLSQAALPQFADQSRTSSSPRVAQRKAALAAKLPRRAKRLSAKRPSGQEERRGQSPFSSMPRVAPDSEGPRRRRPSSVMPLRKPGGSDDYSEGSSGSQSEDGDETSQSRQTKEGAPAKNRGRPEKNNPQKPEAKQRTPANHGRFTESETRQISRAVEAFRDDHGLTQSAINDLIQVRWYRENAELAKKMWSRLEQAVPSQSSRKVKATARRLFHNFLERGKWTVEQDEELHQLVKLHGNQWTKIGGLLNRDQQDVRLRWRDYVQYEGKRKTSRWSNDDETQLLTHVSEALQMIRALRISEGSRNHSLGARADEDLIDWNNISKGMAYTRNAHDCRERYKCWRDTGALTEDVAAMVKPTPSWRKDKATRALRQIEPDDKVRLVRVIRESGVAKDGLIPWKRIVNDEFKGRYERLVLMLLWSRLRMVAADHETRTTRDCAKMLLDDWDEHRQLENLLDEKYEEPKTPASKAAGSAKKKTASSKRPNSKNLAQTTKQPPITPFLMRPGVRRESSSVRRQRTVEAISDSEPETRTRAARPTTTTDHRNGRDDMGVNNKGEGSDSSSNASSTGEDGEHQEVTNDAERSGRLGSVDLGLDSEEAVPTATPIPEKHAFRPKAFKRGRGRPRKSLVPFPQPQTYRHLPRRRRSVSSTSSFHAEDFKINKVANNSVEGTKSASTRAATGVGLDSSDLDDDMSDIPAKPVTRRPD